MKRYYILFKGRVQGVGFRWKLLNLANRYHLTGNVRNLDDGDVLAHMQGEKSDILTVISELKHDRYIIIEDYYMKEVEIKKEDSFTVLH